MFDIFVEMQTIFLVRLLSIHPVQSVVNSITQLSGRGCPRIFHMKLFCRNFMFLWFFKMEAGPCNVNN